MRATRFQDWILLVGGIWLFVAPWVLGTNTELAASWNEWVLGVLVFALAWWALAQPNHRVIEWPQAVLGVWLIVSPWIVGFTGVTAAAWNTVLVGAGVVILAGWALAAAPAREESNTPRHMMAA